MNLHIHVLFTSKEDKVPAVIAFDDCGLNTVMRKVSLQKLVNADAGWPPPAVRSFDGKDPAQLAQCLTWAEAMGDETAEKTLICFSNLISQPR